MQCYIIVFLSLLYIFLFSQARPSDDDPSSRLIGGDVVPLEYARYHASLQNLTGHHVCGGAIVSKKHVVTAAHCVEGAQPEYIKVVVGTTDLDRGGYQHDVVSMKIHKGFNVTLRVNDIAIIVVRFPFSQNVVKIIDLDDQELVENDNVFLTGFGALQPNGESSRQMHMLHLPVFSQETCVYAMRLSKNVTNDMFCTFTRIGEGTCHGDSGGPLVKNNKLVGLVSWGIPCAVGFPDVHTRISPYIDWIRSFTKCVC